MLALIHGLLDPLPPDQVRQAEIKICEMAADQLPQICSDITAGKKLSETMQQEILAECRNVLTGNEKA